MRTTTRFYGLLNLYLHRHDVHHGNSEALHCEVRTGDVVTARKAFMEGVAIDSELYKDWAPLIVAWAFGNHEALGYLQSLRHLRTKSVIILRLWRRLTARDRYCNV